MAKFEPFAKQTLDIFPEVKKRKETVAIISGMTNYFLQRVLNRMDDYTTLQDNVEDLIPIELLNMERGQAEYDIVDKLKKHISHYLKDNGYSLDKDSIQYLTLSVYVAVIEVVMLLDNVGNYNYPDDIKLEHFLHLLDDNELSKELFGEFFDV